MTPTLPADEAVFTALPMSAVIQSSVIFPTRLAAFCEVVLVVSEIDTFLDTVEQGRCYGEISLTCEIVGSVPDLAVDPENLLDHNKASAGRAFRVGPVGIQDMAIGCFECNRLSHMSSFLRLPEPCGRVLGAGLDRRGRNLEYFVWLRNHLC